MSSSRSSNKVTACSVYVVHTHITECSFGAQRQLAICINIKGATLRSHNVRIYVFLYGSHTIVIITKQTALIQFNTIHVYFISKVSFHVCYMFRPVYLGLPQARHYKNLIKEFI